jgi:hypothetical protein
MRIGGKRMFRRWKFIFLVTSMLLILAACGTTVEERATVALEAANEAFQSNDKDTTESYKGVYFYNPLGYTINENSDNHNIVLEHKEDMFILFINPNEKSDSHLFYDLLQSDPNKQVIDIKTFTDNGVFGFAAIVKAENDKVELIASVGGVKMTALLHEKKVEEELPRMMEIVRSIKST